MVSHWFFVYDYSRTGSFRPNIPYFAHMVTLFSPKILGLWTSRVLGSDYVGGLIGGYASSELSIGTAGQGRRVPTAGGFTKSSSL